MKRVDQRLHGEERDLSATLLEADHPTGAAVLMMHGYKSDKQRYGEFADAVTSRLGATCLTIDLPGHGESEGNFSTLTLNDYIRDAGAAYDYLQSQPGIDPARIGIAGASYGGYLAAMVAAWRNPKSLLLRAPAIYENSQIYQARESLDKEQLEEFRQSLRRLSGRTSSNMALRAIADFPGEVTVVESENDESINPNVIHAYLSVARHGIHKVIRGAEHRLEGEHRETFKQMLVEWAGRL